MQGRKMSFSSLPYIRCKGTEVQARVTLGGYDTRTRSGEALSNSACSEINQYTIKIHNLQ
jgi:hypothetical protein